jgi:hypothetical protein
MNESFNPLLPSQQFNGRDPFSLKEKSPVKQKMVMLLA